MDPGQTLQHRGSRLVSIVLVVASLRLVTARAHLNNDLMLVASVGYGGAALNATFLPGGTRYGNIIFLWGRYGF